MKYIRSMMISVLLVCVVSLPVLAQAAGGTAQSKWVFKYEDPGAQEFLDITITRSNTGWDVRGNYQINYDGRFDIQKCAVSGTYYPETGRFKGKCTFPEGPLNVDGYRNQDGTGFFVRLGTKHFTVKLAGAGTASLGAPGKAEPPQRKCTVEEAAVFTKMQGSFKSYRMLLTISGSCEDAKGTFRVAEWCEGVEEKGNPQTERTNGSFKGRMQGSTLSVSSWAQDATKNHPTNNTGTSGSCTIDSEGNVSCSGFGCGTDPMKKQ